MLRRFRETAWRIGVRKCMRIRDEVFSFFSSVPIAAADVDSTSTVQAIESLLRLIRDVAGLSATGFKGAFKKECTLLTFHCSLPELTKTLKAATRLLQSAGSFDHNVNISPERAGLEFKVELQSVKSNLEKALAKLPYDDFMLEIKLI
ncbi:unnamed protein product [Lactuca virosa]|uniref:PUB 12/19-like N-terminal domain-containing protein n=1 Tax=Lactuca virosa TaxID=75947 RepID=A0AAU9LLK3_9ASTR|nr:unnamed protein product [Lactuca virosa]